MRLILDLPPRLALLASLFNTLTAWSLRYPGVAILIMPDMSTLSEVEREALEALLDAPPEPSR